MRIMCLRYNGEVKETSLTIDEAGSLMANEDLIGPWFGLHLFIDHTFSCYEECSLMECLGPLCPN